MTNQTLERVEFFLNWKNAQKCEDSTMTLPLVAEWRIIYMGDSETILAFKRCYRINDDSDYWVPLNQHFTSFEEAEAGVKRYLTKRGEAYLDKDGNRIAA